MSYKYDPPTGWPPTRSWLDIDAEFRRWNSQAGQSVVSDYALPMQRRGQTAAGVRFLLRGSLVEVKVEKWGDFGTNLRCCYLIIRDMRLGEARGLTEALREAYAMLPAPVAKRDRYEVLGVRPDSPVEVVEGAYRALAKSKHPDAGGSEAAMRELNEAFAAVKAERR